MIFLSAITVYSQNQFSSASKSADVIRALNNGWLTAYDRYDSGAIRRIFDGDARMIHSDGRVITKLDELKNVTVHAPPELKASWRAEDIEVRFYGDIAISSGMAIQEGQHSGQSFARKYRYTNVYVRRKKQRQLISAQYSKVEKK